MQHARLFAGLRRRRGTGGCKQPAVWPGQGSPPLPRRLTLAGGAARATAVPGARLGTGHPTLSKKGMRSALVAQRSPLAA